MAISLMTHIPDDTVVRGIEDIVERYSQLHHT